MQEAVLLTIHLFKTNCSVTIQFLLLLFMIEKIIRSKKTTFSDSGDIFIAQSELKMMKSVLRALMNSDF